MDQFSNEVVFHFFHLARRFPPPPWQHPSLAGCNKQACHFRDNYDEIRKHEFAVYALSADSGAAQGKWQSKVGLLSLSGVLWGLIRPLQHNLPYSMLSDPKRVLIEHLGAKTVNNTTTRSHFVFEKGTGKLLEARISVKPEDRCAAPFLQLVFQYLIVPTATSSRWNSSRVSRERYQMTRTWTLPLSPHFTESSLNNFNQPANLAEIPSLCSSLQDLYSSIVARVVSLIFSKQLQRQKGKSRKTQHNRFIV